MQLSICLDAGRQWSEISALARQVDSNGWNCIYVSDHFMRAGTSRDVGGSVVEAWTTLTALAGITQRVKVGSLVLCNTFRHPAVVANMAATLDLISGGRLVLGLGSGWQVNEHAAYGIDLPSLAERSEQLDEACAAIVSLLTAQRTTMEGKWLRLIDAPCEPKPLQAKLPLLIGGGSRQTMKVAARHADVWHAWGTAEEMRRRNERVDLVCAEAGRDARTLLRATGASLARDASDGAGRRFEDEHATGGSPGVVDQLHAYADAGIDEFIVRDDRNIAVARMSEVLAWFSEVVMPLLPT